MLVAGLVPFPIIARDISRRVTAVSRKHDAAIMRRVRNT